MEADKSPDFDVNAPAEDVRQSAILHSEVSWNGKPGLAVLKGTVILFFTDKANPVEAEAQQVLPVENVQVKEAGEARFAVSRQGEEEVTLEVKDNDSRAKWIEAIKKAAQSSLTDLSAEQQQKLKEFEDRLAKENVPAGEGKRIERIRFLKRTAWNVEQAVSVYNDYLKWRVAVGADKLKMKDVHKEAISGKVSVLDTKDKAGRPILLLKPRLHERANATILNITQHAVYFLERVLEIAPQQQICCIVDMAGLNKDSVDIRVPKTMFDILMNRYPNIVANYLIVNQPIFFTGLWGLVRHWMDADFASRVNLLGNPARLTTFVDPSSLPIELGGKAEDTMRDWMRSRYKTEGWNFQNVEEGLKDESSNSVQARILAAISSEPAVEDVQGGCRKRGYMNKESGWVKRFQRQFFVIKENVIYYFKDEKSTKPEGIVGLANARLEDGQAVIKKPFSFMLVTTLRTYYFYLDTQKERDEWWEAISSEIVAI